MITRHLICALSLLGTAMLVSPASAQLAINWHTVDGGGQTFMIGGGFSLGGTSGQCDPGPASGPMTGGNFTLTGGFWVDFGLPCPADLDGDGMIGQGDLGVLLAAYGTCPGDPGYNAAAGALAPGDPCVTQADLGVLLAVYGTNCP